MKINCKKASKLLLMGLLTIMLLVQAAVADSRVSLIFNGHEYQADVYVEEGVSYVSVESLTKIPGITIEAEEYVPLRKFFENREGDVDWNNAKKQIIVSWREKKDDWSADKLVIESSKSLQELNTYKMNGNAVIEMAIPGAGKESLEMPEMSTYLEGAFQQEPLAIYIKQTVGLPVKDLELNEEEASLLQEGTMVTEMVWTDKAIYQKTPLLDKWIIQDLGDMDMMGKLTGMLQTTPQQSLEMMRKFGIVYVFGEDVIIDGQEYYTVKNYIDSITFKKVIEEFSGDFNMAGLITNSQDLPEQGEEGTQASMHEIQQVLEQLLSTMELDYYIDSFINKETLLTEGMLYNMKMKYYLDETLNPQGPVNIEMKMAGEFKLCDFGKEIQIPDVSNAITQKEFMELMMKAKE